MKVLLPILAMFASVVNAKCGVERWTIKTGTDPDVAGVNLQPKATTIAGLRALAKPAELPADRRVPGQENQVYQINATLIEYIREGDQDFHLVLQDEQGLTMIAEIPDPACVGVGSPFAVGIKGARAAFIAHFHLDSISPSKYNDDDDDDDNDGDDEAAEEAKAERLRGVHVKAPVVVQGVYFFDFIHGQTGVAPNGVELHPVLQIDFIGTAPTPVVTPPSPTPAGGHCCYHADGPCSPGDLCCSGSGQSYASASTCRTYGEARGCVWTGADCAVPAVPAWAAPGAAFAYA